MPYSHIKPEERKAALISRIKSLYPERERFNFDRAAYKLVHGFYDEGRKTLPLRFPFAFEIIALPLSDKVLNKNTNRPSIFIGGVNYSVSPRGNRFEGEYKWWDQKSEYGRTAFDIVGILDRCGFCFEEASGSTIKLPSVIAANLISPRIDYKGKSKSDIDTQPFSETIIEAVTKLASQIPTFQVAGYRFYKDRSLLSYNKPQRDKITVEDVLEEVLRKRKEEAGL